MAKPTNEAGTARSKLPSMKTVLLAGTVLALAGAGSGFTLGYFSIAPDVELESAPKLGADAKDATTSPNHDPIAKQQKLNASTEHVAAREEKNEPTAEITPDDEHRESAVGGNIGSKAVTLDPIVTNIAAPSDVWVRLEAVIKLREPMPKDITDQIHQDYLAFFHTMRLQDLDGSSAFIDLKAELMSRANFRAGGRVEAIYIKTFLFE
jgi:flagellar protein FliL